KRQEQLIIDGMNAREQQPRREVVSAWLLTASLDPNADRSYLQALSEQLHVWDCPFEGALFRQVNDPEAGPPVLADKEGMVAVPSGSAWIVAGSRIERALLEQEGAIAVFGDAPVTLREWPDVYEKLYARLEKQLLELESARSFHVSIQRAVEYLQSHYMDEITLELMSEQVHVSPAYFSRLFMKETGRTFTDYLTALRLERAQTLLLETNW